MQSIDNGTNADAGVSTGSALGWPTPAGAVQILPADSQRTNPDAWHQARLDGIGGSDVPTIVRAVKWETPYGLWLTKTGRRPPIPDNGIMERGRYLEPALAQFFADKTGIGLRRTGTWARLEPGPDGVMGPGWARCNPDRLTADGGVVEIKAPNHADWGELWTRGPALHAVVQLMWCFAVLGVPHGYVVADGPDGLRWWRVERDLNVEAWLLDQAWVFLGLVLDDEPPDVDGYEATTLAIKQASAPPEKLAERVEVPGVAAWARRRHELKDLIAANTKELNRVENNIKAALMNAVTATDQGRPVISWRYVALDTKPYRKLEEPK